MPGMVSSRMQWYIDFVTAGCSGSCCAKPLNAGNPVLSAINRKLPTPLSVACVQLSQYIDDTEDFINIQLVSKRYLPHVHFPHGPACHTGAWGSTELLYLVLYI